MEQKLLALLEHLSSLPVFSVVSVAQSLVFCVVFSLSVFVFLFFSFDQCVVCPSIYRVWLPLRYLQTLLVLSCYTERVTVNNVININYTSTNLSPENIELRKSPRPMAMEMQVMAWDRQENRFNGPPLVNWISIDNRDIKSRSCKSVFQVENPYSKLVCKSCFITRFFFLLRYSIELNLMMRVINSYCNSSEDLYTNFF